MSTHIIKLLFVVFFSIFIAHAQTDINYEISFENAVHHEALIKASYTNLPKGTLSLRMSRTSPGRYAIHEFAKNVYDVQATNDQGKPLTITRPNPYQWNIDGHHGTVHFSYILYADRGDGTYSQIDETHAHLNIPATFIYAPEFDKKPIQINFIPRHDLQWKIATQLKHLQETTYFAPSLQYFMDSPTELSNHQVRSFQVDSNGKKHTINFTLHHQDDPQLFNTYFKKVKQIVLQQKAVFGELPDFDFNKYTFLACYMPNVSRDGMEHRNSTILTSTKNLADEGMTANIGTVSHEFFHAWNVERIRPESLEPFNFEEANMSGELWFAEGFTSYYTNLILCRSGIITPKEYVNSLIKTFNYVWNSPGRTFFNPIEMSYQAPFVDAATSIDPVNRENTFISYYSYGSILGLALDLSLRKEKGDLNLDGFMKSVWIKYGKSETPYTIKDLHNLLNQYAGKAFGDDFFNNHIYNSKMPDYKGLLSTVGVTLQQSETPYLGINLIDGIISENTKKGSPAYIAGLTKGDKIIAINNTMINESSIIDNIIQQLHINDTITITYKRFGKKRQTNAKLGKNPSYHLALYEDVNQKVSRKTQVNRKRWLAKK